jgi:hypothetical protein
MAIGNLKRERDPDSSGAAAQERDAVRPELRARGCCVSAVGLNEVQIRRYIRDQERLQRDQDQGELKPD